MYLFATLIAVSGAAASATDIKKHLKKLAGISKNSYYKYKKELLEE